VTCRVCCIWSWTSPCSCLPAGCGNNTGNRQQALYLLQRMFDKTWLRERPAVGPWRTKGNYQRGDLCKRVA